MASHLPMEGDSSISLEEQSLNDLLNSYGFENPPDEFILYSFTLCDITRDGQKELALYSQFQSGLYCVLHREGDTFYGVYMPIRWFQGLQKNGIFGGSSGAATHYYRRLHFEDATFWVELLGNTDWDYFAINENEVSEAEFDAWREEILVGEIPWYIVQPIQR